ncbi:membrane protein [Corynebacterium phocae]|uniref:Membrane protein n=1 Tax=Corynebacterium phocae TaxID=161895 RepID=A0A1L7D5E7_9CORY|nr:DUF3017 domain-containing protein [Corynebacterium phocae]APT93162.1 membrane protein [Corynebacterium phocae]KAA8722243.1 DUF3017 domain-containing protein [Corynebacterium phocae]
MRSQLANPHDRGLKPSPVPGAVQWLLIGAFVAAVGASAVFALLEHWRRATFVLGAAMLWLSFVRLSCDSARVGVLAVRSRRFDSLFTATLGAAMAFLAYSVDSLGS